MVTVILAELVETFVGVAQEALQVEYLGRPHAGETAASTCKTPSGKSFHLQDTCTSYQYAVRSVPGKQLDQCQTVLASSFCACSETLQDSFHYQPLVTVWKTNLHLVWTQNQWRQTMGPELPTATHLADWFAFNTSADMMGESFSTGLLLIFVLTLSCGSNGYKQFWGNPVWLTEQSNLLPANSMHGQASE